MGLHYSGGVVGAASTSANHVKPLVGDQRIPRISLILLMIQSIAMPLRIQFRIRSLLAQHQSIARFPYLAISCRMRRKIVALLLLSVIQRRARPVADHH